MERVFLIDKDGVIGALDSGCRVYYIERGKQDVWEFTSEDAVKELEKAEMIFAVKKVG